jgi:benzoate-CoA ligase
MMGALLSGGNPGRAEAECFMGTEPISASLRDLPAPPASAFNFAEHLLGLNRERASRVAYVDDGAELTYGLLDHRVRRLASALMAAGIRREERVLLLMHDNVDWPVCFLGALYAGVVPVAVNTLELAETYAYMLENSRARAVMVSAALLPVLRAALATARHEVGVVIVSRASGTLGSDERSMDSWVASHEPLPNAAETVPDDPAFWLYSSGSTGKPKAAVHTHANPYFTSELYGRRVLGLREDDVCFSAAKLFFAYGLGNALTFPLSVGAKVVLMSERATPSAVFKRWLEHGPTVFFGAPTGYATMLASPELPAKSAVRLRLCSSAGEALPSEIGRAFAAHFGCDVLDGIGTTEMLHIFVSNRPGDIRYGASGRVVDGYEVELRGPDGRPVPPGEIGDLYVKGPTAALMYWRNREKSLETFQGAWTKTGDKYTCDPEGYYTYAGRADDMLKVSGVFVSPFEIEATLMKHSAVLECAVIGIPNEEGLTRTKAFVVRKPGAEVDEASLKAFMKEHLAPYKYARSIELVDELPKTATGKIQRFKLREREIQNMTAGHS